MKLVLQVLFIAFSVSFSFAQSSDSVSKYSKMFTTFEDFNAESITQSATMPEYDSKEDKIKLSGTIYLNDGVTPAKDVIVHFYQPNENGVFVLDESSANRSALHRVWLKTDSNGNYELNTFMPNTDVRNRSQRAIHAIVRDNSGATYEIIDFRFDDDPFLSKHCRRRIAKRDASSIVSLKQKEKDSNVLVGTRNIVLK